MTPKRQTWKLLKLSFVSNGTQNLDIETSTTSTDNQNNALDASPVATDHGEIVASPIQRPETFEEVTQIELLLLSGLHRHVKRSVALWRSGKVSTIMKYFIAFCLLICMGRFFRWYISDSSSEIHHFLRRLDLESYYPTLVEHGYEQLDDILWATEQDLVEAGISKRPHRKRILRNAAATLKASVPPLLVIVLLNSFCLLFTLLATVSVFFLSESFRIRCRHLGLWILLTLW